MSSSPSVPDRAPEPTVSTGWCVLVNGPCDVMPALSKFDAMSRAHKVNEGAIGWLGAQDEPNDPHYPSVWAVPCWYGEGSDAAETCPFPVSMTATEVEAMWREY